MSQLIYSTGMQLGLPGQVADTGSKGFFSYTAQESIPIGSGVVAGSEPNTCRLPQRNVSTIVFSDDFRDDNTIDLDVNGEAIDTVSYSTDNATTLELVVDAINEMDGVEAESSGAHTIIVSSTDSSDDLIIENVVVSDSDTVTTAIVTAGTSILFSADFVALNTIDMDVNSVAMGQVTFTSNQATTLAAIVTAINLMTNVTAVSLGTRGLIITTDDDITEAPLIENVAVASGVSQATSIVAGANIIVFADDFVTDNTINLKVNNSAITQVDFTTDNATTLAALVTNISAKADVTAFGSGAHTIYVRGDAGDDPADITNVVIADGDPPASATVTPSSTDTFLGIALLEQTVHQNYSTGVVAYDTGSTVSVMSSGRVYIPVEQTLTTLSPVYLRIANDTPDVRGGFRKDADGGNAFVITPYARWLQGASAGDIAELEINLP